MEKMPEEKIESTTQQPKQLEPQPEAEKDLKEELAKAKALAESYYDQLVRLKAEFENYRKRMEREKENHRQFGKEEVFLKQIHLYDIVTSALQQINEKTPTEKILSGLEMIVDEFRRILESEGIQEIEAIGLFPDPRWHEVIAKIPASSPEIPPGQIVAVIQRGFTINGRLLRPAKVCVAEEDEKENSENNSGGEV